MVTLSDYHKYTVNGDQYLSEAMLLRTQLNPTNSLIVFEQGSVGIFVCNIVNRKILKEKKSSTHYIDITATVGTTTSSMGPFPL
jgi:hypothetical protein